MPKRVFFIITQSEMGGAQKFLLAFAKHLKEKGYELLVATGSDGDNTLDRSLRELGVTVKEIKSLKRDISPWEDLISVYKIRSLIKEFYPDDLFLLSSKAGFIGSLATTFPNKIPNLRVIYRIGGWTFNDPWPKWKKKLWKKLEKTSARWKDVILVNNFHDFQQAKELKINPREKLALVHNGLDTYTLDFMPRETARSEIEKLMSKISGKTEDPGVIVGTIANLYPSKGLEYLIKSASYLSNGTKISIVILGEGREREKLEKLIIQEKLSDKVFLIGQVPDAYHYLSAFDIFVLPSVKEGFPWALIEAMAAKLPVIATPVGAVPEIIEDGKNGFMVEKANPGQIARKIKEIIANENLKKELGIQAHQTVLFKFTESKMLKETEAVL